MQGTVHDLIHIAVPTLEKTLTDSVNTINLNHIKNI